MKEEIVIYPDYTFKDLLKHNFHAVLKRKVFLFIMIPLGVLTLIVDFIYMFDIVDTDEWFPNG